MTSGIVPAAADGAVAATLEPSHQRKTSADLGGHHYRPGCGQHRVQSGDGDARGRFEFAPAPVAGAQSLAPPVIAIARGEPAGVGAPDVKGPAGAPLLTGENGGTGKGR